MKKKIVVTGGQLFNKGAQAMTFITVDEMAKRYPDLEPVLLSNRDYRRNHEERKQYRFSIQKYPGTIQFILLQNPLIAAILRLIGSPDTKAYEDLMKETELMIDISGYALGSNWGYKKTIIYLTRIAIARRYGIPVYLMPQSFGPFDYKGFAAPFVKRMIQKNLRYAKAVMCREQDGYKLIHDEYGITNATLAPDLVLQNVDINPEKIYKKVPKLWTEEIPIGSVAVIPNQKAMLYGDPEALYKMYQRIAEILKERDKTVYLIYHSAEDFKICKEIKNRCETDNIRIIEEELSCLAFDALVQKFDFVIASRFHAVVHAYRNAVPAVVLGWAVKYRELLDLFGQGEFMFDVRGQIDADKVASAVADMCDSYIENREKIQSGLDKIRESKVFDKVMI